jgi:hypothetical protein
MHDHWALPPGMNSLPFPFGSGRQIPVITLIIVIWTFTIGVTFCLLLLGKSYKVLPFYLVLTAECSSFSPLCFFHFPIIDRILLFFKWIIAVHQVSYFHWSWYPIYSSLWSPQSPWLHHPSSVFHAKFVKVILTLGHIFSLTLSRIRLAIRHPFSTKK